MMHTRVRLQEGGGNGQMPVPGIMRFRSFKLRQFGIYAAAALLYPAYAYLSSGNMMIKLIDAMTVTGLVFVILGIVYSMIRHGDFDIAEYVTRRTLNKGNVKPFKAFKEDKKEERKDSMNYPFFTGLLLLICSAVLSIFY